MHQHLPDSKDFFCTQDQQAKRIKHSFLCISVVSDEMQNYAAFHLGLHSLQKYSFRGFLNTKRKL